MQYKMLVLDLDDTLLRDDYSISERNKQCLMKAQEQGVFVVLASGRPTQAMMQYAEELELAKYSSYIISYNGAIITDIKNGQSIFEQTLNKQEIHDLYDYSKNNNLHILTYKNNEILTETESEYIDVEKNLTGMPINKVPSFKAEVQEPAVKCILLEDPIKLKNIEPLLKADKTDLSVAISKPFFLEVMPKGIDKAASIQRLGERLNIKQEEIIAVGNAGNDLTMVEYAGLGVWVDNVTPELRDKGDAIVSSNNDDGVAEVVEQYILN
ncbi:Cof-type HAD-IIB family hydrolase [Saccharicrinis aurantiacus]|uniref:Cof-type HAD-IIB family hydrolase n=1 Tax=Saccharicrinis aurantiacus TaxID=1849719 RepID=UPI000837EDCC|nr:Cof-type HAD-IIB family hydrolase [Saccharicrinis aurantiacus]